MFEWISSPEAWVALGTLTALEVVLGIDNVIFISILVARLPEKQRNFARNVGLFLAMMVRFILLLCVSWIMGLTDELFSVFNHSISGRDLILIIGGLFLLAKSTHEIHHALEGENDSHDVSKKATLGIILIQIAVLDLVFSLDSVITAVGLADQISIMYIAVMVAIAVMMLSAKAIGNFVDRHPTVKVLALSFLILIGFTLLAEGFHVHVPKGYMYFAMAFSIGVELLNMKMRKNKKPIALRKKITENETVNA